MSLFKKTIIITNGKTLGYASIVAIGSTVGIKIAVKECVQDQHAVVKLKDTPYYFDMDSNTLEQEVKASPFESDEITVLVMSGNSIIGRGGNRDIALEIAAQARYTKREFGNIEATKQYEAEAQTSDIASEKFEFFAPQKERNFYLGIIDKIDEMMTIYPSNTELNQLIEGGRFVRVQYDDSESYTVGTITVDDKVSYIVYAVEGLESVLPPEETREVADFLKTGDDGRGYWVIMQSADTGEVIKKE